MPEISSKPLRDRKVGEIAAQLPGASDVFRRFGIDFCCQGDVPLTNSVSHRNLELDKVEAALNMLDPDAAPAAPKETSALIEHIQTRYHDIHRIQLRKLVALSRKVEERNLSHPNVPAGLARTLEQFLAELEILMKEQEMDYFPALRNKPAERLAQSIRFMKHEHDEFAFFLDRIDRLTNECTLPEDACRSWQELYAGIKELKADLIEHFHLENNVLFPRFEVTTHD